MPRRRIGGLLLVLCFAIGGCSAGQNFEWNNVRKLKPGMSKSEVTALLGRPDVVRTVPMPDGGHKEIWAWVYVNLFTGNKSVSVGFVDEKLFDIPMVPTEFK